MGLIRWLRKPSIPEFHTDHVDLEQLDHSMNMLKSTTEEVSHAAVCAAKVLGDRLHYAEFRFNSTIDHIDDLVIVKDGEGRWKTLNKVGQQAFGWHHGEYYDKTDEHLAREYPLFANNLSICKKTDEAAWEQRKAHRSEEIIPNGNTNLIYDVVKTPIFEEDGDRKELIIIGRDITESRERSRRMKACFQALNSASDVIAIVDSNCRIFFCNDQFVRAFHVHNYDMVVGQKLDDVVGTINPKMWLTVQKNKTWKGDHENYHLAVLPMMNGEPKPIYHVCTFKKLKR